MAVNKKNTRNTKPAHMSNKKKSSAINEPKTPIAYLIPFIGMLTIIPLIVHLKKITDNHLANEYWHSASSETTDIFLYWKSVFIIAFGVILLLFLIAALLMETKKLKWELEYAPLTVYLVFVLLSTFVSENIYFSLHGIENHFESMWVLIAYVIIAFYGAIVADNKTAIKIVTYGWLAGTWVLMLIGMFQAFKCDIYTSNFMKYIIFPLNITKLTDLADSQFIQNFIHENSLSLNFDLGQVYITLYNPNYVGYFASITIPAFLTLAIYAKEYWKKALFGVTVIGVFICTIGSGAKNGIMALLFSFLFMIIMFRRQLIKHWYVFIAAVVILGGVFLGINGIRNNSMINSINTSIKTLFKKIPIERHLDSIQCNTDCLTVTYDGRIYNMVMYIDENGASTFRAFDAEGNPIATKYTGDGQSIISDDKNIPFTVTPVNYSMDENTIIPSIELTIDGYSYSFSNQLVNYYPENTGYYYLNASGKWVQIGNPESVLFNNNPTLFSNRGYIWARTIPLLKKYIFTGSGPDTFSLVFPNYDYVDSAYVGFLNQIVTKPHSLYLQIGVQTGVISLLAFISFFMIYFVRSIILYWKHPLDTLFSKFGIGIAAGLLGYMVSGLTNDSTITYAPVFWGIMGVGIAINRIVRKELAEKPKTETAAIGS